MIRVAILTVSDSAAQGAREDVSGPATQRYCDGLGWQVVETAIVPDEYDAIAQQLIDWADSGTMNLILTTGGTGIAPRDVTPEATTSVLEREIPGIAEVMRSEGRSKTKLAVLSRAAAGYRNRTLIVNLPGSPKGAVESLDAVAAVLPHAIDLISGRTEHSE
jgi:molybdopterin adenylyltransferase